MVFAGFVIIFSESVPFLLPFVFSGTVEFSESFSFPELVSEPVSFPELVSEPVSFLELVSEPVSFLELVSEPVSFPELVSEPWDLLVLLFTVLVLP